VRARELFDVSGLDPVSYLGASVLSGALTALVAVPSLRRVVRVDPVQTLGHERDTPFHPAAARQRLEGSVTMGLEGSLVQSSHDPT
jgi:hypothetical protein